MISRKIVIAIVCAVPVLGTSEDLPYQAATGLWQVAWNDDSTGYMCVDVRHQPWRLKETAGIDLFDCLARDVEWREPSGNRLRITTSRSERHLQEGQIYRLETTCVTERFDYRRSQSPFSMSRTEAQARWTGDFRTALEFTESAVRTSDGVIDAKESVSYRLKWLGECPAVLPAGNKCRASKTDAVATSEWPACDPELTGKTNP